MGDREQHPLPSHKAQSDVTYPGSHRDLRSSPASLPAQRDQQPGREGGGRGGDKCPGNPSAVCQLMTMTG